MKRIGRPKKVRKISQIPRILQFSPRGRPGRPDEVVLRLDHFEAIKLADFQGLKQAEAARQMGISRSTFGRILREAHLQVARALIEGKIIRLDTKIG